MPWVWNADDPQPSERGSAVISEGPANVSDPETFSMYFQKRGRDQT